MNPAAKLTSSLELPATHLDSSSLIMGVLNITPDSFSDGGKFSSGESAYRAAQQMVADGAAIIDIGGESTGPGSKPVSAGEELARITPLLQTLPAEMCVPIDTYKAEVAKAGLSLGAKIINDVSALRADSAMADTIAAAGAHVVLMYSKEPDSAPHASFSKRDYDDVVAEIAEFLLSRVAAARAAGIAEERIILDPGMGGFISRCHEYSWEILSRLDELCAAVAPYPVLIGTSRKGFLDVPLPERDPLSALTATDALRHGAAIVRVHNVRMTGQFISVGSRLSHHRLS